MSPPAKKKAKPHKATAPKKTKAKVTKQKKVQKVARAIEEKPKKGAPKAKKIEQKKEAPIKIAEKKEAPAKTVTRPEAPVKTVPKREPLKLGPPPMAVVATRHVDSDSLHERQARGFSFGELSSAGVPMNAAKSHDLSVDVRRRSVVAKNVEVLKGWLEPAAKKK
jgi:ribosomal protein L13E